MGSKRQPPKRKGSERPDNSAVKSRQPYGPADDPDASAFWQELQTQTDRGVAVLGAAFLEWRIRGAIERRFMIWDIHAEHIFGTDTKGGRLGFWEQSEIAYGLGLIGPVMLDDLQRIGQIRNRLAHHTNISSFDHKDVAKLIDKLETDELLAKHVEAKVAGDPRFGKVHRPASRRANYIASIQHISHAIWIASLHYSSAEKVTQLPDWHW